MSAKVCKHCVESRHYGLAVVLSIYALVGCNVTAKIGLVISFPRLYYLDEFRSLGEKFETMLTKVGQAQTCLNDA